MNGTAIVAVAMFQSHQEASMAQAALAAEAIDSELAGSVTADTLAYYGTATGGVRLLVREPDAARAGRILESIAQQRNAESPLPEWRCPACGEQVDGGFDLCWSCGQTKPGLAVDADLEFQSDRDVDAAPANPATTDPADQWTEADVDRASAESADAMVERAWRAAVLGIVFFPLLAIALLLVLRASRVPPQQTSWKFYGTLLIVCGMGLFWWLMLSGFGWR
jgi:hypothetical protein